MTSDLRQSEGWAKYLQTIGWEIDEIEGTKVYIRNIPLLGSVIKIQRPAVVPPVSEIDRIARKHRALLVKLEPPLTPEYRLPTDSGFAFDPHPNLPTKTIVIDLTLGESKLWNNLSQDARQRIRKAESTAKLQVTSYGYGDSGFAHAFEKLHHLLKETGKRQGFWVSGFDELGAKARVFDKNALIFLVTKKPLAGRPWRASPLAGALILISGNTAFCLHAASSLEGQELGASYLLFWEIISHLRSKIAHLDFEGIADERFPQTKRWEKFTVFKKKWGGKEVEYPPPLIKYYRSWVKTLFAIGKLLG